MSAAESPLAPVEVNAPICVVLRAWTCVAERSATAVEFKPRAWVTVRSARLSALRRPTCPSPLSCVAVKPVFCEAVSCARAVVAKARSAGLASNCPALRPLSAVVAREDPSPAAKRAPSDAAERPPRPVEVKAPIWVAARAATSAEDRPEAAVEESAAISFVVKALTCVEVSSDAVRKERPKIAFDVKAPIF